MYFMYYYIYTYSIYICIFILHIFAIYIRFTSCFLFDIWYVYLHVILHIGCCGLQDIADCIIIYIYIYIYICI